MQRFSVGQRVRTVALREQGHTRLPRYLAQHAGVISRVHGLYPLADDRAAGLDTPPQALYGVSFEARELFGDGTQSFTVIADLWDAYLEDAS